MNRIMLLGRIGKDPELAYTRSGTAVAKFSLATTKKWKAQTGEQQEKTEWHRIVAWGNTAETVSKFFYKGMGVYVEGAMEYGSYENKDGATIYTADVRMERFEFVPSNEKRNTGGHQQTQQGGYQQTQQGGYQQTQQGGYQQPPAQQGFGADDDDIPF